MESSKQRKENEVSRKLPKAKGKEVSRRLPKKIEERLIRGKYREAPAIDYGVKHKESLLIMRIYTCVCFNAL